MYTCKHLSSHAARDQNPHAEQRTHSTATDELISQGLIWHGDIGADPPERAQLRPQHPPISFNVGEIDSQLPAGGLTCGSIHELYYHNRLAPSLTPRALPTFFVARAVDSYFSTPSSSWDRLNTKSFPFLIVWIGRGCWPTPLAIPPYLLSACVFIDPPTEKLLLWSIETALRSPAVKLVISSCPRISLTTTKRFSYAAQTYGTTALLLRDYRDLNLASSAASKWLITPTRSSHPFPLWRLSLEKLKGGTPSVRSWIIGLESGYEEREAISLHVFPAMVDRGDHEKSAIKRFGT